MKEARKQTKHPSHQVKGESDGKIGQQVASANIFTGRPSSQWFAGVIVQTFIEKIDLVLFPLTHNNILDPFHFIKIDTTS